MDTEQKIIDAARNIFHRLGFDGARMQDIADDAGINKAMLHYYYRSKDKLFEAVFQEAVTKIFPVLFGMIDSDLPLEEKIEKFVHTYIDLIWTNPFLPGFIIHELSTNPQRLTGFLSAKQVRRPENFIRQVREGIDQGRFIPIDPDQLLVSILSQCVFPFVAKPMIQFLLQMDENSFQNFIQVRKVQVTQLILNGIRK